MPAKIGVRREDKNEWERRVPLTPYGVSSLSYDHGIATVVQPSPIRALRDEKYAAAGAELDDDLSGCDIIVAIKEVPPEKILPGKVYLFFSHTIKGQKQNLPLLVRLLEAGCTLIDYERIVDDRNRRLIAFGRFAGLAGMVDTLWALGRRLEWEGWTTPFSRVLPAHAYGGLGETRRALRKVGAELSLGLPPELGPVVFARTGTGQVAAGVREILDFLPCRHVDPRELPRLAPGGRGLYRTGFQHHHMVEPIDGRKFFRRSDYYAHPEHYRSAFGRYWPHATVLINGLYWDPRYPRLITKAEFAARMAEDPPPRLKVVGDISCDVGGAIELTVRATDPGDPVYVYDPATGEAPSGVEGRGAVVLAIDNLPCQFSREASEYFSRALVGFIPAVARADLSGSLEGSGLPMELQRGCVVWRGAFTPAYAYLARFLGKPG